MQEAQALKAVAASVTNRKGGSPPAHVWGIAYSGLVCEGINTIESIYDLSRRRFAPQHDGHIERGTQFLRKTWILQDGGYFHSRHCKPCGDWLEARAKETEKPDE